MLARARKEHVEILGDGVSSMGNSLGSAHLSLSPAISQTHIHRNLGMGTGPIPGSSLRLSQLPEKG